MPHSRLYNFIIGSVDKVVPSKLRPIWEHEAGPKTIFFWAPMTKWGLVIAALKDLNRPAENISMNQAASLVVTGMIWCRYAFVIIPKNYVMFSVNFFMAVSQSIQVMRALKVKHS